jgi:hypothetical protein
MADATLFESTGLLPKPSAMANAGVALKATAQIVLIISSISSQVQAPSQGAAGDQASDEPFFLGRSVLSRL